MREIEDKVIDVHQVSSFSLKLSDYIQNASSYNHEAKNKGGQVEDLSWLVLNPQTGEFSASGSVLVGTYYIKVTATKDSDSIDAYFVIRAKNLTTDLSTNITKGTNVTQQITSDSVTATVGQSNVVVKNDGTASHQITGIAEATSQLPDSVVEIDDSGNVTTSTTTINNTGDIVEIKVEGKVTGEDKAIHTLTVGEKETKAKSKVAGTTTTIKANRTVETIATVNGNEAKAVASADGKATHVLTVNGIESKATVDIPGGSTTIDVDGSITTTLQLDNSDANIKIEAVVETKNDGETVTKFESTNLTTGEKLEILPTLDETSPKFPAGSEVTIKSVDGKIKIHTTTSELEIDTKFKIK